MTAAAIDEQRIAGWLERHVGEARGPFSVAVIAGGHSNLTYAVSDSVGHRHVVRFPPTGRLLPQAHDMAREHRILEALSPTDVPVPQARALCRDRAVHARPFYVMDHVDGLVLRDKASAELDSAQRRATELRDRWSTTWPRSILDRDGGVAAILDGELCTLGDPLADLGLLLVYWTDRDDPEAALQIAPTLADGFPTRSEVARRYARASGRDLSDLGFYICLGYWKLAAMVEGVYTRQLATSPTTASAGLDALADAAVDLAARALGATDRL